MEDPKDGLDTERLGALLGLLRPAPDAWVQAALAIPRAERDLAAPGRRLEEDALLRDAVDGAQTAEDAARRRGPEPDA